MVQKLKPRDRQELQKRNIGFVFQSFHLLDAFSAVGMTMLLLLTGLETDLRLLRNLGRAALIATARDLLALSRPSRPARPPH